MTEPGYHETERLAPEPKVGNKIGPYRLMKLIGAGTTGRVFEVEHEKIGRRAAMKTLSAEHATRPGAIKRLFAEALAVNRITNPHIVEVTDLVEAGEHHLVTSGHESISSLRVNALVMELLEGKSLGQTMIGEGPMPPERFLPVLAQVCQALAAAHAAGFVHRDLKPDNIFLTERGGQPDFVKLLDFGLAKTVSVDPELMGNPALATLDGTFVGTPGYVSPEQASGKPVDHRTDIYAVGVILYEVVCARLPFEGSHVGDFLIQHITAPAPHLPDEIRSTKLGQTLDAIIQRCLEKAPAARFSSAAELADLFERLAHGQDVEFAAMETYLKTWKPERPRPPSRITRAGLGLAAGLGLSLTIGLVIGRWHRGERGATAGGEAAALRRTAGLATPAGAVRPVPPAASGPRRVTLSFASDPPGAEVHLQGDEQPLGVTPFERTFERSGAPLPIEIRLLGYEPVRVATSMLASRAIDVTLTRSAPPAAPPLRKGRSPGLAGGRPVEREATINPFR
jgi:serine/threonine-protein kinase